MEHERESDNGSLNNSDVMVMLYAHVAKDPNHYDSLIAAMKTPTNGASTKPARPQNK